MKNVLLFCAMCLLQPSIFSQQIFFEDFDTYTLGPIGDQNPEWVNLSNAQVNVKIDGGNFVNCSGSDNQNAYLSFESADSEECKRTVSTSYSNFVLNMKATLNTGISVKIVDTDDFAFEYLYEFAGSGNFEFAFILDFVYHQIQVIRNGVTVKTDNLPAGFNSIDEIHFNNSSGKFKLGCVELSDVTDVDGDGYLASNDCDDNDAEVNPGKAEIAYNGKDDDCNPATLDDDLDQDGYPKATDCNDDDANVNPGKAEIAYNGKDDDCNPATLDDDFDQDGYPKATDCNDDDANINPGKAEIAYNGKDDDCNPATLDDDLDQDGYSKATDCNDDDANVNPGKAEIAYNGKDDDCNPATLDDDLDQDGYPKATDCNDDDANINPGKAEIAYNGKDDDCNPATLDDDLDQDGYPKATDCNDDDAEINPGATEIPGNSIDENCDGILLAEFHQSTKLFVELFPNPTRDYLEIKSSSKIDYVKIYNIAGLEVSSYKLSESTIIYLKDIRAGIYFLHAFSSEAGGSYIGKLVVKY